MPPGHQKQEQSPEREDSSDFPEAPLSASSPLSQLSYFTEEDQFTRDAESQFLSSFHTIHYGVSSQSSPSLLSLPALHIWLSGSNWSHSPFYNLFPHSKHLAKCANPWDWSTQELGLSQETEELEVLRKL